MSCGVGRRHSWDLALLWLWYRLAPAAVIQPLSWELPYAAGVALKSKKKKSIQIFGEKTTETPLLISDGYMGYFVQVYKWHID